MNKPTIQKVINHLKRVVEIDKINSLHIEWFGEPFLYFEEIIKPISVAAISICHDAGIPFLNSATTNGYYLSPSIHSKLIKLSFKRFQISIDGTREFHNKVKVSKNGDSPFDVSLNNINSLLSVSQDISILLRINYTKDNLQEDILKEVNEIINIDNRSKVEVMFRRVWQESVDKTRTIILHKIINQFEIEGYCKNRFDLDNGFIPCYADKKYYNAINYNGSIVKCTANDDLQNGDPPGVLQNDGSILWKKGFLENYYKVRFENKICRHCKHLPICMGNCAMDYKNEDLNEFICKYKGFDSTFEDIIIHHIEKDYEI